MPLGTGERQGNLSVKQASGLRPPAGNAHIQSTSVRTYLYIEGHSNFEKDDFMNNRATEIECNKAQGLVTPALLNRRVRSAGKVRPMVLLWALGVPIPILLIIFLARGCS